MSLWMSLWKNIKGIWDPQARAESLIEIQVSGYKRFQESYPDRDPNFWLAQTLNQRHLTWSRGEFEDCLTITTEFSVLQGDLAPTAMGIFILSMEQPDLAAEYEEKFGVLMTPVHEMKESGEFDTFWRTTNHWTAANYPSLPGQNPLVKEGQ